MPLHHLVQAEALNNKVSPTLLAHSSHIMLPDGNQTQKAHANYRRLWSPQSTLTTVFSVASET